MNVDASEILLMVALMSGSAFAQTIDQSLSNIDEGCQLESLRVMLSSGAGYAQCTRVVVCGVKKWRAMFTTTINSKWCFLFKGMSAALKRVSCADMLAALECAANSHAESPCVRWAALQPDMYASCRLQCVIRYFEYLTNHESDDL